MITTEEEYQKATARIIELFNAEPGTDEEAELEALLEQVTEYEGEQDDEDDEEGEEE